MFSIAPMMGWTDNHYRTLARMISKHAWLYTEMLAAETIVYQEDNLVLNGLGGFFLLLHLEFMTRLIYVFTVVLLRTAFWSILQTSIPLFFKLVEETWTTWLKQPSWLMLTAMMKLISSMSD